MKLIPQFVPNYFGVANKCVNSPARMGANMNCNFVFFYSPSLNIVPLLLSDILDLTQDRLCNSMALAT